MTLLEQIIELILALFGNKKVSQNEAPKAAEANGIVYRLTRKQFIECGIFSELTDQNGKVIAQTLEHSYNNFPKIPNGTFKCVRGPHRLHSMVEDFTTFEITGVEGHSNILFHWGNYNKDSDGCVLLGDAVADFGANEKMITNSKATFAKFMADLNNVNEFSLIVS